MDQKINGNRVNFALREIAKLDPIPSPLILFCLYSDGVIWAYNGVSMETNLLAIKEYKRAMGVFAERNPKWDEGYSAIVGSGDDFHWAFDVIRTELMNHGVEKIVMIKITKRTGGIGITGFSNMSHFRVVEILSDELIDNFKKGDFQTD